MALLKCVTVVLFCAAVVGLPLVAPASDAGNHSLILDTYSYWRVHMAWRTTVFGHDRTDARPREKVDQVLPSPLPPAGWMRSDFDDGGWLRQSGPVHGGYGFQLPRTLALVCLRGTFMVTDPSAARGLTMSLRYRGGAVVYLNGREVARAHLPEGDIEFNTLADAYPIEAYRTPGGAAIRWGWRDPTTYKDRCETRIRALTDVHLPSALLRKGANVLGIELHRAPVHPDVDKLKHAHAGRWSPVGLVSVEVRGGGSGVVPNVARPPGVQVWDANPLVGVFDELDYGGPNESLRPVRMVGCRNGVFCCQVVVSADAPIEDLQARAGGFRLVGETASVPALPARVLYPLPDGDEKGAAGRYRDARNPRRFDTLAQAPRPAATVQPIWILASVPADAKPGEYRGTLTVRAAGTRVAQVPLELKVADFRLPDPRDFRTFVDLIQSPDSVAIQYKVPLWSEEHFRLIERSFGLMGEVGARAVYIPLVCRTHFGNAQSMVRWTKRRDGTYAHDFAVMDRYLDLWQKHIGTPEVVCLYAWDYFLGGGYFGRKGRKALGAPVSLLDPDSGEVTELTGPVHGSEGSTAFWKPVFDEIRARLNRRGIPDKAIMIGLAGDTRPYPPVTRMFSEVAPYAKWVVHSHAKATSINDVPVGYLAQVWGGRAAPDPSVKRVYGWRSEWIETIFPRYRPAPIGPMWPSSHLAVHRKISEAMLMAGYRGFGRVGADFWPVLEGRRGRRKSVLGRYPQANWHQLGVSNSTAAMLSPGPNGARPTIRLEMLRQGVQEAQARIFLEGALTEESLRGKLGEALAKRCQDLLDDRARMFKIGYRTSWQWFASSGWQRRNEALFEAAADVARALARPSGENGGVRVRRIAHETVGLRAVRGDPGSRSASRHTDPD